jgi:DNA-directed RNA polymerase specialized sigma24 family protein
MSGFWVSLLGEVTRLNRKRKTKKIDPPSLHQMENLYCFASFLVSNLRRTEALVEETYFRALKAPYCFFPERDQHIWLFRILLDLMHRNMSQCLSMESRIDKPAGKEPWPIVPDHQPQQWVVNSVRKVPPVYREVLLLADALGFSNQEIRRILRISEGETTARLNRGREIFRLSLLTQEECLGSGGSWNKFVM